MLRDLTVRLLVHRRIKVRALMNGRRGVCVGGKSKQGKRSAIVGRRVGGVE